MTQKRFKNLLMARGVSANTSRGLAEYMKAVRYCIENGEEVVKLADAENVTFESVKVHPYAETYKRILEGRDFLV
nr:MAG TPA: hypothetical protein [Caudoviricetes sp.]